MNPRVRVKFSLQNQSYLQYKYGVLMELFGWTNLTVLTSLQTEFSMISGNLSGCNLTIFMKKTRFHFIRLCHHLSTEQHWRCFFVFNSKHLLTFDTAESIYDIRVSWQYVIRDILVCNATLIYSWDWLHSFRKLLTATSLALFLLLLFFVQANTNTIQRSDYTK